MKRTIREILFYMKNVRRGIAWLAAGMVLPLLSSCQVLGLAASTLTGSDTVAAAYKGLAGQKCGVMVWADEVISSDFHNLAIDTANGIQEKLEEGNKAGVTEVKDLTFVPAEKIAAFQQAHAETQFDAVEEVAPKLGVARLVYVEIERFQTQPNESPELLRGTMTASLKVVEIKDGKGKVVYAERNIVVVFPKNCPPEGLPNQSEPVIYRQTIDAATTEISERFIPHPATDSDYGNPTDVHN